MSSSPERSPAVFGVVTLFPEMYDALKYGVVGRALGRDQAQLRLWPLRDYSEGAHGHVDDRPYGGGAGMVLSPEPLARALDAALQSLPAARVIYPSAEGRVPDHRDIQRVAEASADGVIFIAGRYEGIDERIVSSYVHEQWSVGDFVLSGGDCAILTWLDAIVRLLPGSLGDPESAQQDSFVDGLLDWPHYTRPRVFRGLEVPPVLFSGDHEAIRIFRLKQALLRTYQHKPWLLKQRGLSEQERRLLEQALSESGEQS